MEEAATATPKVRKQNNQSMQIELATKQHKKEACVVRGGESVADAVNRRSITNTETGEDVTTFFFATRYRNAFAIKL